MSDVNGRSPILIIWWNKRFAKSQQIWIWKSRRNFIFHLNFGSFIRRIHCEHCVNIYKHRNLIIFILSFPFFCKIIVYSVPSSLSFLFFIFFLSLQLLFFCPLSIFYFKLKVQSLLKLNFGKIQIYYAHWVDFVETHVVRN